MELRSPLHDLQPGFSFRNAFRYEFRIDLPIFPPIELGEINYGLCGGFCFGTLDYYYAGLPIPTMSHVPMDGSPLWRYLWRRQFDSLLLPIVPVRVLQWMLLSDEKVAQKTLEEEVPFLIETMQSNRPVVLALIRNKGFNDPTQNHQVLVTQFIEENEQIELAVYDPNHPNRIPSPLIRIQRPVNGHQFNIEQSTGEDLRGFFVIDYESSSPPNVEVF